MAPQEAVDHPRVHVEGDRLDCEGGFDPAEIEQLDHPFRRDTRCLPWLAGPGVGGHCIPLDPHYLAWKMRTLNYRTRFIELAGEINTSMPYYVVDRVALALGDQEPVAPVRRGMHVALVCAATGGTIHIIVNNLIGFTAEPAALLALKLDATGRSDPEKDSEGLRKYRFDQQVKAQKLKELVKGNLEVKRLPPEEEPGAPAAYGGAGSIAMARPGGAGRGAGRW